MYKLAIAIVTLLLIILSGHPTAQAATIDQQGSGTKVSSQLTNNPNKVAAPLNSRSLNAASYHSGVPEVRIYDAWLDMRADSDGDGYHHLFDITFDIDSIANGHSIYVIGELQGSSRQILFRTDPYTVNGGSGEDTYQVRVLLTDGYPPGQYQLILHVYDANSNNLLITYDGLDNHRLNNLFLEDSSWEGVHTDALSLYQLNFELSQDWDADGYYSRLTLQFDADAPGQLRWVYARISLIDPWGQWIVIRNSADFAIEDYSDNDRYQATIDLDYGIAAAGYQLAVELYDADTHTLLLTSTTPEYSPIQLESSEYEESYGVIVEEEYYVSGSGGSFGVWSLLMMLMIVLTLRRQRSNK